MERKREDDSSQMLGAGKQMDTWQILPWVKISFKLSALMMNNGLRSDFILYHFSREHYIPVNNNK